MNQQIQAIYEHGIIRPLEPLELEEGENVEVILLKKKHNASKVLAEIANLPIEGKTDKFSGADHDKELYPNDEK